MSISRITRERLYQDERTFNELLPYVKYEEEYGLFIHSDASIWSMWELSPKWMTSTSDLEAFQLTSQIQEMMDSLPHNVSAQWNWITTFEIEHLLRRSISEYPSGGTAGWMAKRWTRMLRASANHGPFFQRPRKLRLVVSFRNDPPWRAANPLDQLARAFKGMLTGKLGVSAKERTAEYQSYARDFRGLVDGTVAKLSDLGFRPRQMHGQDLIDLLYPILNRRSTKSGKFRRGRSTSVPRPEYDSKDFLSNQISETHAEHPENGIVKKDGRYFRAVSIVKPPKQCLPLMITPLQSAPYENIISVTYSKDPQEKQIAGLDALDGTLGMREITGMGRANQKVQHQIAAIRAARSELYANRCQMVRVGVHQTFFCQTKEEAMRASAEAVATFPQLNGARGMAHEVSDLGVIVNSMPGCYDPATDGAGWTNTMRSSRAVRLFPLWGNWRGSKGSLFILPSLWNRELVGFDLYDSETAPNVLIAGVSGAGKSYLLCFILITMNRGHYSTLSSGRLVERQPITFVFDKGMVGQPCGFEKVARL
ncbi:MAG: TraC family protein, partial [Bdellovibrionales bacterium]|nr:TraC family protein [Bdellovibrionales bacterium]